MCAVIRSERLFWAIIEESVASLGFHVPKHSDVILSKGCHKDLTCFGVARSTIGRPNGVVYVSASSVVVEDPPPLSQDGTLQTVTPPVSWLECTDLTSPPRLSS